MSGFPDIILPEEEFIPGETDITGQHLVIEKYGYLADTCRHREGMYTEEGTGEDKSQ